MEDQLVAGMAMNTIANSASKIVAVHLLVVENGYLVTVEREWGEKIFWVFAEASHATDKAEEILLNAKAQV